MPTRRSALAQIAAAAAACAPLAARAGDGTPIRLLVGASAGTDFTARLAAQGRPNPSGRLFRQHALAAVAGCADDGRSAHPREHHTPRPLAPQALAAARQAEFRQYAALAKASGHVPE